MSSELLPVKLVIEYKRESEIRRFCAPATFDALGSIVQHMWNGSSKAPALEYVDEDGDRVRFSSDLEWQECVRLHRASRPRAEAPLVLYASRPKKHRRAEAEAEAPKPAVETEVSSDDDAPAPGAPVVPKLDIPTGEAPRCVNGGSARSRTVSARLNGPASAQEATMRLLSELYGCDAEEVLTSAQAVTSVLGPLILYRQGGSGVAGGDVTVDIDRAAVRVALVRAGNDCIERADLKRAETLLRLGLRVFPNDVILFYNLGCALARQGHTDDALAALAKAVAAGYSDFDHLAHDTDLASLRSDARFMALMAMTPRGAPAAEAPAPASEVAAPAVEVPAPIVAETPTEAPVEAPKPVVTEAPAAPQPTPAPVQRPSPEQVLVEMFPTVTLGQAHNILVGCGGDINQAVLRLLSIAV